jgi:putative ABC transport system ATP-binding protein
MSVAVETRAVTKHYRNQDVMVEALRDVDVEVAPGEFVAVMGPSGSGKSTLLHLLGGLDVPTSGEVLVNGRSLSGLSRHDLARLRSDQIGFVFQLYNLMPSLTVAENISLPAIAAGLRPRDYSDRVNELIKLVGLANKHDRFPPQLSGGEQQRVAVARALVRKPAVLLADEPTGNLDTKTGAALLDLFVKCHADGQTIVLVTHDAKVASAADRVLFMRDGRVVDEAGLTGPADDDLSKLAQLGDPATKRRRPKGRSSASA